MNCSKRNCSFSYLVLIFRIFFLSLVIATGVFFGITSKSKAAPSYSAYALDVKAKKTLHSYKKDAYRYPASLTKIMTLYILFEELKKGRIKNNTLIKFSKHATRQPPSKLGIKKGGTISAKNAVLALITKSANDVAVAVAEKISGNEYRFAKKMTNTARRMGMKKTRFYNASGLHHSRQKTTAYEMAILAKRIYTDFPEYYKLFKTKSFTYKGIKYYNHNKLLGRYSGVDGVKTGYISKSGYNLAASYRKNNKHVIVVVFGGKTGRSRDLAVMKILNKTVKIAKSIKSKPKPVQIAKYKTTKVLPIPLPKKLVKIRKDKKIQRIAQIKTAALNSENLTSMPVKNEVNKIVKSNIKPINTNDNNYTVQIVRVIIADKKLEMSRRPHLKHSSNNHSVARLDKPINKVLQVNIDNEEGSKSDTKANMHNGTPDKWIVQIGAYNKEVQAWDSIKLAKDILKKAPNKSKVDNEFNAFTEKSVVNSKTYYRARLTLNAEKNAKHTCKFLNKKSMPCFVTRR